jgi:hypothetical protein
MTQGELKYIVRGQKCERWKMDIHNKIGKKKD